MTIVDSSTPAVVLQMKTHGGLAICRTLGRLGVTVYGVEEDATVFAASSRYCRERFSWNMNRASADDTLKFLLKLGCRIGQRSVLIATSDEAVLFCAVYGDTLKQWFILPSISGDLATCLISKKEMFVLARQHGIPTPESAFPQCRKDLLQCAERLIFPVMLKDIFTNRLAERTGQRMLMIRNRQELLHYYDLLEDHEVPNLMVQEYIPGGDDTVWMFNGYFDRSSQCLAGMTGKKLRQTPPHKGSTALGICLANQTVHDQTMSLLSAVRYTGPVDIDYRYDPRDHQYKILDVNPRFGSSFRLFSDQTGMDVVRAMYLDLTDQVVPVLSLVPGRKWCVEDADVYSCLDYYREKQLTFREWVSSFRGVEETAYFAFDDPIPFLKVLSRFMNMAGRSALRDMFGVFRGHS